MPEGPEVSLMSYLLNENFKNSILKDIKIVSGRYIRHGIPDEIKSFIKNKLPTKIIDVKNKGKFLYIELKNNLYISLSLGLSGHIVFTKNNYTHYHFETNKGIFYLEDMRNFATIHILTSSELEKKLSSLGPDLLHNKISDKLFIERVSKYKKKPIASVLLNQKVFSGIGNYIRADALYLAKISPFRLIQDLSNEELKRIKKSLKTVMNWALKSHIKHKFMRSYRFKVYGRKLTGKDEEVVAEPLEKGRSIYWVPSIQK